MAVNTLMGDRDEQENLANAHNGSREGKLVLERISEVLLLFAALFDEPPPKAGAAILHGEVFPRLRKAVDLTEGSEGSDLNTLSFSDEYERLFLLPGPVSPYLSAYHPAEKNWDGPAQIARLMTIMELPWRKTGFTPGKACPFAPDHLAVVFSLLALLIKCEPNEEKICGRRSFEWCDWLAGEMVLALTGLQQRLAELQPAAPAYENVTRLAHAYLKTCRAVQPWVPAEAENSATDMSASLSRNPQSVST